MASLVVAWRPPTAEQPWPPGRPQRQMSPRSAEESTEGPAMPAVAWAIWVSKQFNSLHKAWPRVQPCFNT